MTPFAKKSNLKSIVFIHFFAKQRKSVEKMIHKRKIGVPNVQDHLNPGKAIAMAIFSIICLLRSSPGKSLIYYVHNFFNLRYTYWLLFVKM